ncbi:MAG: 6-phosphofructokinase, partial [Dehalococcoidales bacterium]|nr:6-phosphofructokinase [Dehalococcoidales bacterium]
AGVLAEAAVHCQIGRVYGMRYGVQGALAEDLVDLSGLSAAVIDALRGTPAAALGTCRYRLRPEDPGRVVEVCRKHDIRYLFYIGGNDSADTSHRVALAAADAGYEMRVIGIPKTIDNDLPLTDHSPGYGSIARFIALATAGAGRDSEASARIDPVKLIEVMGRNAGWLAAASALGRRSEKDAPHLIYFPERPLSVGRFLADVESVYKEHGYAVVVVTETVRDDKGQPVAEGGVDVHDAFGHKRLSGAAHRLANLVEDELGIRARWDKPGTIQRSLMAASSKVDLDEAFAVGRAAVAQAVNGQSDRMVTLEREPGPVYQCRTGLAPLAAIANQEKTLPPEFINPAGNHVTEGFLHYARPLIGEGVPEYPRLLDAPALAEG